MKKFISGVVLGFVASWALAFASTDIAHNGSFWNRLNGSAKDGYASGYRDAMIVSVNKLDGLNVAADLFHWKGARKIIHELSHQLSLAELTPTETVKSLDQFYSNQEYSELDIGQALQALSVRVGQTAIPPAKNRSTK
jgi:hypothetical protein